MFKLIAKPLLRVNNAGKKTFLSLFTIALSVMKKFNKEKFLLSNKSIFHRPRFDNRERKRENVNNRNSDETSDERQL